VRSLLQRVLPRGEFGRGVLALATGTTVAQGISILTAPILTRLYSPAEFGSYSVAISALAILITLSSLGYQFAVPLPDSDVGAACVLVLSLLLATGMGVVASVVLWFFGQQILTFMGAPGLARYAMLLPLGQIGGSFVAAMTYWAVRTKKYSAMATTQLTQSIATAAVQVGLGAAGLGVVGLLAGDVTGRFSGSMRLARVAWETSASAFRSVTRAGIVAVAKRYRRFPIFSTPASIVNTLGLQAPLLLIVALYGTDAGGKFALASRLCGLPVTLLAGAVGQVYFAEGATTARERPNALRPLFLRTMRALARIAIVPFSLLAIVAPLLAGPVFGDQWSEVGLWVAILAPMYFIVLVANPIGATLDFLERQEIQFLLGIIRLSLLSGVIVAASVMHLAPVGAVALLSVAGSLTYSLFALGAWYAINQFTRRDVVGEQA